MVCYNAVGKTGELELEGRGDRKDCLSDSVAEVACMYPGNWQLRQRGGGRGDSSAGKSKVF